MLDKIKKKIDRELGKFILEADRAYSLSQTSPLLFKNIKDFILRDGKRIRPTLFIVGYLGFSKRQTPGLFRSSLATELLHDFLLIHDDIIDKSDTRRGKPSMHAGLNKYLAKYPDLKFNGQDLSIVIGDIIYALAIDAFLSIDEDPKRKEKSLRQFIKATVSTGSGEFIELISGLKPMEKITKADIYKIYDYKTSHYTFSTPLACGAILAGAADKQTQKLIDCGIYLGRAFQIKDDLLGLFNSEKRIGKSILADLQEAKKTLIIWQAYNLSNSKTRSSIKKIMTKKKVNKADLIKIRQIVVESGSLQYANNEVSTLLQKAKNILKGCSIKNKYKQALYLWADKLLKNS